MNLPVAIILAATWQRTLALISWFALRAPVAQMEEHLICTQDCAGSIPVGGLLLGGGSE
jgi:hypothetical protein